MHPDLRRHALGREQRGIGAPDELVERGALLADGDADRDARRVAAVLHAHCVLHAVREAVARVRSEAGEDGRELVAAEAVSQRARIGRAKGRRDGADALVADRMAEPLVRVLEVVEVEHDEADAALVERVREILLERAAVAQAGQRVGRGGLLQMGELGVRAGTGTAANHAQQREEPGEQGDADEERRQRHRPGAALHRAQRRERMSGGDALGHVQQLQIGREVARGDALGARRGRARRQRERALLRRRGVAGARDERASPRAARGARTCGRRRGAGPATVLAAARSLELTCAAWTARTCDVVRSIWSLLERCAQIEMPVTVPTSRTAVTTRVRSIRSRQLLVKTLSRVTQHSSAVRCKAWG